MARPITREERQLLMDNPELVMFMPRRQGLGSVVFLLVIPVTAMAVLAGLLFDTGAVYILVESAPVLSTLTFVAVCVPAPWVCLRVKTWYDEACGWRRELQGLLGKDGLAVEVVRITVVVPQRAEVYADGDDGPFVFGIASTRNAFVPEVGMKLALVCAGERDLAVRPDPRASSFVS